MSRFIVGMVLFLSSELYGAGIRDIRVLDDKIHPVHLRLGQSTILRFKEKPKKVVVGNQNYVGVEFIDSDVTLQPLGEVVTNLFVYGERGHVYGFRLIIRNHGSHDDLINAYWGPNPPVLAPKKREPRFNSKKVNLSMLVDKTLLLKFYKVSYDKTTKSHIVDAVVQNVSERPLNLLGVRVAVTRKKVSIGGFEYAFLDDRLAAKQRSKLRIFIKTKQSNAFTVDVKIAETFAQVIIPRSAL